MNDKITITDLMLRNAILKAEIDDLTLQREKLARIIGARHDMCPPKVEGCVDSCRDCWIKHVGGKVDE